MSQPTTMPAGQDDLTDADYEQELMDLLADMSDDEVRELVALAEAMSADGGE